MALMVSSPASLTSRYSFTWMLSTVAEPTLQVLKQVIGRDSSFFHDTRVVLTTATDGGEGDGQRVSLPCPCHHKGDQ